jgi:methylenetetrahydrofolate--tRNA-(uracil-5-)-methyltransferase
MPPLPGRIKKADRKQAYTDRARAAFEQWLQTQRASELA